MGVQTRASLVSPNSNAPSLSLAPMEGVVDWPMRQVLAGFSGVDRAVTEFIRVTDRLLPSKIFYEYCPELQTSLRSLTAVPVFVQLLGGKAEPMAENAAFAASLGAPGIDLNFGCPAKTVNRHDGGAALLINPDRLTKIISCVRSSLPSEIPLTAKVRLGFQDKSLHQEIALAVAEGGADLLTVHARTREEGYRPPAHWNYIASMQKLISIPVVANGEIWSPEDYLRCVQQSGCHNVALGRGLLARPSLAREIKGLASATPLPRAPWSEIRSQVLAPFWLKCWEWRGEHYALCRMKQWASYLQREYPEAKVWFAHFKRLTQAKDFTALWTESNNVAPSAAPF